MSNRWEAFFDLAQKQRQLEELEHTASAPNFWDDTDRAQTVLKSRAELESQITQTRRLFQDLADLQALLELLAESDDLDLVTEFESSLTHLEQSLRDFELARMLVGPHDACDAILEINAGAGGTEAQDWGEMLLRMYLRYAESRGFQAEVSDIHAGEEAGIKSAVVLIRAKNAFGFLRCERGVHRLVRISPFDSNARRHTSFASVSVMPDIDTEINIEIRDEDLRVDTYRSSGAGGQHVNKTDSAVRLTHLETGIVVACQNERSQHKNKATAMKLLKAKLYARELEKQRSELDKIAGERRKIDFGSQIRSYTLQPYQLIKDHRTGVETSNIQGVLDGGIDEFIESYLMSEEWNRPDELT